MGRGGVWDARGRGAPGGAGTLGHPGVWDARGLGGVWDTRGMGMGMGMGFGMVLGLGLGTGFCCTGFRGGAAGAGMVEEGAGAGARVVAGRMEWAILRGRGDGRMLTGDWSCATAMELPMEVLGLGLALAAPAPAPAVAAAPGGGFLMLIPAVAAVAVLVVAEDGVVEGLGLELSTFAGREGGVSRKTGRPSDARVGVVGAMGAWTLRAGFFPGGTGNIVLAC
mmetsp:Transcript_33946/g.55003  ORF Transcript_33946/g.55003 Transcript_33946/m.55003 type:complete len:223 (-) Transcript_33946:163-831(-)